MIKPSRDLICLPFFFIIGAQKAGTTALFSYMLKSENVLPPRRKELHFFDRGGQTSKRKGSEKAHSGMLQSYASRLHPNKDPVKQLSVDPTPSYVLTSRAAESLRLWLPQAKAILLVREPVSRAFSEYQMVVRRRANWDFLLDEVDKNAGHVYGCIQKMVEVFPESRIAERSKIRNPNKDSGELKACLPESVQDAAFEHRLLRFLEGSIRDKQQLVKLFVTSNSDTRVHLNRSFQADEKLRHNFEKRVKDEMHDLERCTEEGAINPRCSTTGRTSDIESGGHLFRGLYGQQIRQWLQSFPPNQLHIVPHSQFLKDSLRVVSSVSDFIGIRPFLSQPLSAAELDDNINRRFPEFWKEGWLINGTGTYEPLSGQLKVELLRFFEPFNQDLAELLRSTFQWPAEAAANPF